MILKKENVHDWVYNLKLEKAHCPTVARDVVVIFNDPVYDIRIDLEFTGDTVHKYLWNMSVSIPDCLENIFKKYFTKSFMPLFREPLSFADIVVNKIMESEEHQKSLESERENTDLRIKITPEDFHFYSFENLDNPKKLSS